MSLKLKLLIYLKKNFVKNNYIVELITFFEKSNFFEISWCSFITLTYPECIKYERSYIKKFELYLEKNSIEFFWVLEYGKKDNIHIHVLINKFIKVDELRNIWSLILKSENIIVDIREITDIENLIYYFLKDFNIERINNLKKILNVNKLHIWNSSLIYKKKLNEIELEKYEKELEDLLKFETFLEYKNDSKYSWIFLLTEKLSFQVTETIKNNTEKKIIFEKLLIDNLFFMQLTKCFILYILSHGTEMKYSLVLFLEKMAKSFLKLFPQLHNAFGSRTLALEDDDNTFENVLNKKIIFISNGLLTLYELELKEYIEFEKSVEYLTIDDQLPARVIKFKYNEKFKNFLLSEKEFSENYNNLITGFLGYKYLMVVEPRKWKYSQENTVIGGYLYNKMPLIITEGHAHQLKISKFLLTNLNYLQAQCIILNNDLINELIRRKDIILNFFKNNENLNEKVIVLEAELKLLWKEIYKHVNNEKKYLGDYFKTKIGSNMQLKISELNGKLELYREKYADYILFCKLFGIGFFDIEIKNSGILKKYENIDNLYIPYNLDFRGRVYPLNTDLNFHASKLSRALFLSSKERPFNLNVFKIYCVRCYYKYKESDKKSIEIFNTTLIKIMLNYKDDIIFKTLILKANNLYAFLSCCIEFEKYCLWVSLSSKNKVKVDAYMSNFLISLDATSSGSQILSLILREEQFLSSLNLRNNKDDNIGDFYLMVIQEYKKSKYFNTKKIINLWEDSLFFLLTDIELRQFFKNIIMTFNYGLTFIGFLDKFRDNYNKYCSIKNIRVNIFVCEEIAFSFWAYSRELRFMLLHTFFNKLVTLYGKLGLKVEWFTPIKSKIIQQYLVEKSVSLDVRINKLRSAVKDKKLDESHFLKKVTIKVKDLNKVNYKKGALALTANFIHSMDSSLLFFVVNEFRKNKLFIACVHDCFFVNTCDFELVLRSYKKGLIELFLKTNLLDEFRVSVNSNLERLVSDDIDYELKNQINDVLNKLDLLKIDITDKDIQKMIKDLEKSDYSIVLSS